MQLSKVYLFSSEELLLRDEAIKQLISQAQQQGYATVKRWQVDSHFDWQTFFSNTQQNDLFSENCLHELQLNSAKLNAEATKALSEFLSRSDEQNILVFNCDKLDAATLKSKWIKAIEQHGRVTRLWPPEAAALPQWLSKKAAGYGLTLSAAAYGLIANYSEGNLSSAVQTLEKLFLQYGAISLTDEQVYSSLYDSSHYNVFDLVESWLKGDKKRSYKILRNLKAEEAEPTLICWALTAECRVLARIRFDLEREHNLPSLLSEYNIWKKREPLVKKHLSTPYDYTAALQKLTRIEHIIKGATQGNVWDELEGFLVE